MATSPSLTVLAALLPLAVLGCSSPARGPESRVPDDPTDETWTRSELLPWAIVLDELPDPAVVGDPVAREAIVESGLPWRVRDEASGVELLLVPAGRFRRGADGTDAAAFPDERPAHEVVVREPFYLGRTEVTRQQWEAFARQSSYASEAEVRGSGLGISSNGLWGARDGADWRDPLAGLDAPRPGPSHPVLQVSWNDARAFSEYYGLRLPRESEFEYAARAGTATRRWWGDGVAGAETAANVGDLATARHIAIQSAFPLDDGEPFVGAVGSRSANPWGFHDLLGNAWEWTATRYSPGAYAVLFESEPVDSTADDGATGDRRAFRGGSWLSAPALVRASYRDGLDPATRTAHLGFRVARTP